MARIELLSEGWLLAAISLAWWLSASSAAWLGASTIHVVFWLVMDQLAFVSTVFLAPTVLFSILVFFHSNFWLFHHPGWEVPDLVWLSLSGLVLEVLDLSDDLLESSASFWATTTRARI